MSPEEVRKAEELANWEFIKERDQPQELRDHLARVPKGFIANYVRGKLEELVWDGIALKDIFRNYGSASDTTELVMRLQAFLNEFPDGNYAEEARNLLGNLELKAAEAKVANEQRRQETEAWVRVAASTERDQIEAFLSQRPNSHLADAARARIAELTRILWTRRQAVLLSAAIVVAFLLGAGAVAWRLDIWGERVNNRTVPAKVPLVRIWGIDPGKPPEPVKAGADFKLQPSCDLWEREMASKYGLYWRTNSVWPPHIVTPRNCTALPPKPIPVERSTREREAPNRPIEPPADFEPPPPWWQRPTAVLPQLETELLQTSMTLSGCVG